MITPGKIVGGFLFALFILFVWWYAEAENFSSARVSGVYLLSHDGVQQCLRLNADGTFDQKSERDGASVYAHGSWRLFSSTGHVAFSPQFADARADWRGQEDHEVYGVFKNYLGLPSITFGDIQTYRQFFECSLCVSLPRSVA